MRKISEMYKLSGGSEPFERCESCKAFIKIKYDMCVWYGFDVQWKGSYPACKFFYNDSIKGNKKERTYITKAKKEIPENKQTEYQQITLWDYL